MFCLHVVFIFFLVIIHNFDSTILTTDLDVAKNGILPWNSIIYKNKIDYPLFFNTYFICVFI